MTKCNMTMIMTNNIICLWTIIIISLLRNFVALLTLDFFSLDVFFRSNELCLDILNIYNVTLININESFFWHLLIFIINFLPFKNCFIMNLICMSRSVIKVHFIKLQYVNITLEISYRKFVCNFPYIITYNFFFM